MALAGLVPVAVALARARAGRRMRRELGLGEPPPRARLARPLALAAAFALLGLAAAQPSLRREHVKSVRTDAELLVVLDGSRSMLASTGAGGESRARRAVDFAHRLHAALPTVPVGVASLTNRVLPYLFPTVDDGSYGAVLDQAFGVQRPAPALDVDPWVTSFDPLAEVAARRFFSPGARRRVLVVLSDAETRPFEAARVLRELRRARTTPVVVRFWHPNERIFRRNGTAESYRATEPRALDDLRAAGWPAFRENERAAVVERIEQALGEGPVARVGSRRRDTPLAPMLALAALAPLLLVVAPGGRLPSPRLRRSLAESP